MCTFVDATLYSRMEPDTAPIWHPSLDGRHNHMVYWKALSISASFPKFCTWPRTVPTVSMAPEVMPKRQRLAWITPRQSIASIKMIIATVLAAFQKQALICQQA